ncbi:MAG: PKD domain-containing protein, partial [Chitinophagales bacterium]|nr:PKD domain-containing protein [Chitinophagales bacterium]
MKQVKFCCTLFLVFFFLKTAAQFAPGAEWDHCIPNASIKSSAKVSDSLFAVAFETKTCNDSTAIGIREYNSEGEMMWERKFIPEVLQSNHVFSIQKIQTGFILAGSIVTPDSSFNCIFKTDSEGNLIWQKKFFCDTLHAPVTGKIIELSDGKFLFTGSTYTSRLSEVLVMKLNSTGDLIWQKTFGGSLFDFGRDVTVISNGNYAVAATAGSSDFDVTGYHGVNDAWLLMLDTAGTVQWKKTFGGLYNDEPKSIVASGNGFIVSGISESDDGDLNDHHGSISYFDFIAFKMDVNGTVLWKHSYGGMLDDFSSQMIALDDGNFLLTGNSYSNNGDVNDHHGETIYNDQWSIKISTGGTTIWKKSTGGTGDDWSNCVAALDSNNFIIAGGSISKDGDHTEACFTNECHVINGGWLVKLNEHCASFPYSNFSYSQSEKTFSFSNQSTNAQSYLWDFGDGYTSVSYNPTHTYAYSGVYNVCLTAIDICSSKTYCVTVITCAVPVASFNIFYLGNEVQFTNTTANAATFNWDFGDGTFSVEENPLHIYTANGSYIVALTITDSCDQQSIAIDTVNTCNGFVSDFSFTANGNILSFTDLTLGLPVSWSWDFGDGNFSTDQNPVHTFLAGNYNVCLTVSIDGCAPQTICKSIDVCQPVVENSFSSSANFTTVSFTDLSEFATSWNWDFGDGNFSAEQNPSHTYLQGGTYTVCEIFSNACNSDTVCEIINVECFPLDVNFSYVENALNVAFNDLAIDATTWEWNFGDGNASSLQNPSHNFAAPGTFVVCEIAFNPCSSDTICQNITVKCAPLIADFSFASNGLSVTFTDLSVSATSWDWNFGDGNISAEQNPTHIFSAPGIYTVCVIIFNYCGTDTICKEVEVKCATLYSAFSFIPNDLSVSFTDFSLNATTWQWSFGDGNFSAEQNPTHNYLSAGDFNVCLTASDGCSSDDTCTIIHVNCPAFVASFSFLQSNDTAFFTSQSLNATQWTWDFGDGNFSTEENPSHIFAPNASYFICLVSGDNCSMDTICDSLHVYGVSNA